MNENIDVIVSVIMTTYNQESYVEKTLKSILNQSTDFKIEIILHDDASTDDTKYILEKYYKLYPEIIVPIFRSVNIYQQGISPFVESLKIAKGKYIAICEGDDYWIDNNKLQKQFDLMEKNLDLSFCCHNAQIYYVNENKTSSFNKSLPSGRYSTKDLFNREWFIPTASLFFTKKSLSDLPEWYGEVRSQDLLTEIMASLHGNFWYDSNIMSVYRKNAIGSISSLPEKPWIYLKLRLVLMKNLYNEVSSLYKFYVIKDIFKTLVRIPYTALKYYTKKLLSIFNTEVIFK